MLLVAHQMLNDLAHSIRNDIHWGLLMSNDLRWLKVESVLAGGEALYHGGHMHPLGDSGRGGGDPGGLDVAAGWHRRRRDFRRRTKSRSARKAILPCSA